MTNIRVCMTKELHHEMMTVMANIESLNAGKELGGWLLGDWETEDNSLTLRLDTFIIPAQEVTGGSVDINEAQMVDTVKELGFEKANRIKAHWHIHPFGYEVPGWSSVDEDLITDFMQPEKQREIFCFILSSKGKMFARVELNIKTQIAGNDILLHETFDNLPIYVESAQDTELLDKLKARIGEKVTSPVVKYTYSEKWWDKFGNFPAKESYLPKPKDDVLSSVVQQGRKVLLYLNTDFATWLQMRAEDGKFTKPAKMKRHYDTVTWVYKEKDAKDATTLYTSLQQDLLTEEVNFANDMEVAEEYGRYDL